MACGGQMYQWENKNNRGKEPVDIVESVFFVLAVTPKYECQ